MGNVNVLEYDTQNQKATLLCIHGLCSDARIFNYLGSNLSKHGIKVVSVDILGHGKSDGRKGDPNFDQCLQAINELVEKYKQTSKIFILAHSMGCTYALWYASKFANSICGLILLAPYIRFKRIKKRSYIEPCTSLFLKILLKRIFTPLAKIDITIALPGFVKYGGDEILQMLKDKELNFDYSYRYIIDVLAKRNDNVTVLSSVTTPLLIMHGKNDKYMFYTISEEFIKLAKSKDKTLHLLDADHWFYDAIFYSQDSTKFTDGDRQKMMQTVEAWIMTH